MCEVETKLIEQVNPTQLAELISKGQLVEIKNSVSAGLSKVVENQLTLSDLSIVKETFDRLCKNGDTAQIEKEKIASVLLGQMYDVLKDNISFDEIRYEKELKQLK